MKFLIPIPCKECAVSSDNDDDNNDFFCFMANSKVLKHEHRHEKTCLWEFATRYDSNRPAQWQKLARILKLWI